MRGIHQSLVNFPHKGQWRAELWCFLWSASNKRLSKQIETPVIWDAIALIMTSLQCMYFRGCNATRRMLILRYLVKVIVDVLVPMSPHAICNHYVEVAVKPSEFARHVSSSVILVFFQTTVTIALSTHRTAAQTSSPTGQSSPTPTPMIPHLLPSLNSKPPEQITSANQAGRAKIHLLPHVILTGRKAPADANLDNVSL